MTTPEIKWVGTPKQLKLVDDRLNEKNSYKEFMEDYPIGVLPKHLHKKLEIWKYYAAKYPGSIEKYNEGGKWTLQDVDEQIKIAEKDKQAERSRKEAADYALDQAREAASREEQYENAIKAGTPSSRLEPWENNKKYVGGGKPKSRRNRKSKKSKKSKKGKKSKKSKKNTRSGKRKSR